MGRHYLLLSAVLLTLPFICTLIIEDVLFDISRTKKCDTTYINPSYQKVPLALEQRNKFSAYSLLQYKEVHSYWVPLKGMSMSNVMWRMKDSRYRVRLTQKSFNCAVLREHNKDAFPVLFIHGHLGSHEQMRSMASETAKEISRRHKAMREIRWADWYGVNFASEPSGLEPRLLVRELSSLSISRT